MKAIFTRTVIAIFVIIIFFTVSKAVRSADLLSLGSESPPPVYLESEYLSPITWPPKTEVLPQPFECIPGGEEFSRAGQTTIEIIQGDTYCLNRASEKAAGHVYTRYIFSQARGLAETSTATFSISRDQCENYFPAKRERCEQEQNNFSPNILILAPQSFGNEMNLCYFLRSKSPSGFYDYAWLKVAIDGGKISGEYWDLPAGGKSKIGTFTGALSKPELPYSTQKTKSQWKTFEDGKRGLEELEIEFNYKNAVVEGENDPSQVFSSVNCRELEEKPVVEQQIETLASFI